MHGPGSAVRIQGDGSVPNPSTRAPSRALPQGPGQPESAPRLLLTRLTLAAADLGCLLVVLVLLARAPGFQGIRHQGNLQVRRRRPSAWQAPAPHQRPGPTRECRSPPFRGGRQGRGVRLLGFLRLCPQRSTLRSAGGGAEPEGRLASGRPRSQVAVLP